MLGSNTPKLVNQNFSRRSAIDQAGRCVVLLSEGCSLDWLNEFDSASGKMGGTLRFISLFRQERNRDVPHQLFGDLSESLTPQWLIVPGGDGGLKQLFVDPRVHRLIGRTISGHGKIALASGAELILSQVPFDLRIQPSNLFLQRNLTPTEFANQIFSS